MSSAAYLRVSSDKQTALRQREALANLSIDRWYEDSEGSNPRDRADRRPEFQRLLRDVERGSIETIYVASQDRFGTKDAYELGHFFTLLRRHDCRLLDASGKVLNADDDATVITSTVGALTSTREQKEKAGRVLSGKLTKLRAGATYQGGNPPYGFDVACIGPDGKEKWRVVYEGHNRRLKVYPDGHTERFDGKRNRPPKELNDVLRLRPSIIAERVKYARLIFVWFAIENIAPGQIAARLNDLGVSPIFGSLWHRSIIRYMLANPAYLGYPTWNKAGNSRFMEYCGGQVKSVNGQKTGRKRVESDQIRPEEPEYKPLTDQETWDKVQVKLVALREKYRTPKTAPRTAELWLRGLVVCGCCGKPMRAYIGSKQNGQPPGYSCASYMRYGKRNPFGCKQYHVPHDLLEALVLDYLTQTAPEVKSLLDAAEADDLEAARPLLEAIQSASRQLGNVWCEMALFVAEYFRGSKARRKATGKGLTTAQLYSASYRHVRPRIEKAIADKEAELEALLDEFAGLSPKLKERANRRGEALREEIDTLKRDLSDRRVSWDYFTAQLTERKAALDRAVSTLNEEGRHRQKAEALRSVVDSIVCHFQEQGKRRKLVSIGVAAAEDGAVQPLTFPGAPLQSDTRLGVFA